MSRPHPQAPLGQRDFFRWAHGHMLAGDERFERQGSVDDAVRAHCETIATSVRRSIWRMTRLPTWREVRSTRPLAQVAARGDLDGRYLTDRRSLERLPLLADQHPNLRVTDVYSTLLIVDARIVFVGAPPGHELIGQIWRSTAPAVLGAAVRCYETAWRAAEPPPQDAPTFTDRMVDIGFLLTDGATDAEIARRLGVSARTVSADVAEIIRRLGARNRAHAIALIGGGTI